MGHSEDRILAEQWLAAEMGRIWLVAERCLRQFQRVQLRAQPDDPAMAEIEGILTARRAARGSHSTGPLDEDELSAALARAEAAMVELRRTAPIGRVVENLGLRPLELETLLVATAPHIDAPLADIFGLLRGASQRRGVDLALVAQLFRLGRNERLALLDAIDPDRPLLSWRLIQVIPAESVESYGSAHYRAIQPTFDLLSILCGRSELSPALQHCALMRRAAPRLDDLMLGAVMRQRLEQLCAMAMTVQEQGRIAEAPWVVLWGPRGIGKTEVAARIAAYARRPLLAFDPEAVEAGALEETLRRAKREALIRGAVLYLGPLSGAILNNHARELARRLADYPSLVILGIESMLEPRIKLDHPAQEVMLRVPDEVTRLALWESAIPAGMHGPDLDLGSLARGFHLTPGEILETAKEAQAVAALRESPILSHEDLRGGVDRRLRNELGDLARRLNITATWDDLVLPEEDLDRIGEFISRSRLAYQVFEEWGFGERVGYGKGMIALFSGPPGTGKTMLAGLIAKALDLDVYQVDLSQVISKWVGETEKQLGRVFDQAERSHAVLLFDEADALLAKRTEVKTSNDRYGNLAVNYLLQRLEQYSGVAILTSNKEAALDEALRRRLSLHLHLAVPESSERERLWWSMLPSRVPSARNLNFGQLAREYELTGGYIKNITLRAAFLAASEGTALHMGLMRRAVALEMEDMGRLVSRVGLHDLVDGQMNDESPAAEPEPEGAATFDFAEG